MDEDVICKAKIGSEFIQAEEIAYAKARSLKERVTREGITRYLSAASP